MCLSVCLSDHSAPDLCEKQSSHTNTQRDTHKGILALGWMCRSCLAQNMSYCLFMISHQVRGDAACVPLRRFVRVFILMRVSWLSTRTGTRQGNQRHTVCNITEYKCPHYGVSLNVSFGWKTALFQTEREKGEKKDTGGRIGQAAHKSCSESTKPPQSLHLPVNRSR